jgi:hypothetical protein
MKKAILILTFGLLCNLSDAQTMYNYKTKTKENEIERTIMLDLLRVKFYKEFKQDFVFVVNVFNVSNNYAWLKSNVLRKDGKEVSLKSGDYDCCHAEALFKKVNGKWTIVESVAFSTDLWFDQIWDRAKDAPIKIFGSDYHKE